MAERALVVGAARSGIAIARLLTSRGCAVSLCDARGRPEDLPDDLDQIPWLDAEPGVRDLQDIDVLVLSPGVPLDVPLVQRGRRLGMRISGEMEEAFRFSRVPVVAVTGTNGKSTTTALISAALQALSWRAPAGGNLGRPYADLVLFEDDADVHVVEVSSFQAETLDTFRPRCGVWLNLTPDHLDRHGDFPQYAAAKRRVFQHMGPEDVLVTGPDRAVAVSVAGLQARSLRFDADSPVPAGAWVEGGMLRVGDASKNIQDVLSTAALPLPGKAFRLDALAALAAVFGLGGDAVAGASAISAFTGLPHRMQTVGSVGSLRYVDDSKSTNVEAAVAGLSGLTGEVLLVAGGCDDGQNFEPLSSLPHVRRAYGIGEAGGRVSDSFGDRGVEVGTLGAAVTRARSEGRPGETLVLAPGAKSFDQFRDFEERGRRFQELALGPTHFVAVGGAGMSALAEVLVRSGAPVTGSDLRDSDALTRLRALGVTCHVGHDAAHAHGASRVVVSSAIPATNPELVAARERGVPVLHRSELLAEVSRGRSAIAVTGSHGKTTTTALIGHLLGETGHDPCVLVGADVVGWDGNVRFGQGPVVMEADESDGSFERLAPSIAVVTNLDDDHLDHWGSVDALSDAVRRWTERVPETGAVILGAGDVRLGALEGLAASTVVAGVASGDVYADSLVPHPGGTRCDLHIAGRRLQVDIPLLGEHQVANVTLAVAAAVAAGADPDTLPDALRTFPGVRRRFEIIADIGGIQVVDDYAHHPAEIRAVLDGVRRHGERPVRCVFQPHRHSRTRVLEGAFAEAFDGCQDLIVTGVYAADEPQPEDGGDHAIVDRVLARGRTPARRINEPDEILEVLAREVQAGDLVLFLSAGDLDQLAVALAGRVQGSPAAAGRPPE